MDNDSIFYYLICIQNLVYALTAIGDDVCNKEPFDIILEFWLEDESTIALISSKLEPILINDVETLLLSHEAHLEKFKKKAI